MRADSAAPSRPGRAARVPRRRAPAGRRIAVVLLVAAVVVALVRGLVIQSFVVPTGSMDPTVRVGDRVLVSRFAYRFGDVQRGDVVVFDGAGVFDPLPAEARTPLAQAGRGAARLFSMPAGAKDYVKRVIGLPGDRVVCCDVSGRLTVNGSALVEPYVDPLDRPSETRFDVVVPPGRLWVMGDNRSGSADSRAHLDDPGGGTVPMEHVVGRVAGIYWPPSHVRRVSETPGGGGSAVEQAEGHR